MYKHLYKLLSEIKKPKKYYFHNKNGKTFEVNSDGSLRHHLGYYNDYANDLDSSNNLDSSKI